MQNNLKKPGVILAAALLVFFAGGFLLLVHIGSSARTAPARHYAPGYRGASVASAASAASYSYMEDFKRGGEIVKEKGETALAGFFGGSSGEAPASGRSASAGGGAGREEEEDPDGSAFEEYYKKNYASSRGGSASAGQPSGAEMGGGGSAYGGSGGGGYAETSAGAADGGAPQKGEPAGEAATGAVAQAPAPGTGFGKPPAGTERPAAPRLQASLPGKNSPENAGFNPGARPGSSPGDGGNQPYKGGSLSGMPGQKAGVPLDGAAEGMKTGAQKNYDSKVSGGASASAAAGAAAGGAVPDASKPASAGAGGGSGASAEGGKDPKSAAPDEAGGEERSAAEEPAGLMKAGNEGNQPFLESVVVERLNGRDTKYITEEETKAALEESQLKAGASAPEEPREEKGFRPDGQRGERPPDPEKFTDLSEERKTQLKKRVHGFLKRVEIRYGVMDDIFYTPCAAGPEICSEHGLTEGYLTLETRDTAELHLGLKYVEDRWRRYTVGFTLPGGDRKWKHGRKKSAPESPEDSAPGENEQ